MAWSCVPVGLMQHAKRPSELGGGQRGIASRESNTRAVNQNVERRRPTPKHKRPPNTICRQSDRASRNKHSPSKRPNDATQLVAEVKRYTSDCFRTA